MSACEKPTARYPQGRTGTGAGYMAHYRRHEDACQACLDARAAEERSAVAQGRRYVSACARQHLTGTPDGYLADRDAGQSPCVSCMAAWVIYCEQGEGTA